MVGTEPFIAVYMLASRKHGTLYIGVTSDLISRVAQHRHGTFEGFTKRYRVKRLVWFERFDAINLAIQREKSLKKYKRDWKINLIERENPDWNDLFPGLLT
ncbi:MAG TPA: GIY-YIG nuclease family protein [Caulobacteraceae bacterium]|nr:GIY-YIG nuclease family protein [Caulobacteraceae bacterium]